MVGFSFFFLALYYNASEVLGMHLNVLKYSI